MGGIEESRGEQAAPVAQAAEKATLRILKSAD